MKIKINTVCPKSDTLQKRRKSMNNKDFHGFLEGRKQSVASDIEALSAEGRTDEANILKAKFNVYDIAKSVFDTTVRQSPDTVATAFPALFSRITGSWSAALKTAKEHGDDRRVLVEEAKLSAVAEITNRFAALLT